MRPPVETFTISVELDAADQLETSNPVTATFGVHPALAALELLLFPDSTIVILNKVLATAGHVADRAAEDAGRAARLGPARGSCRCASTSVSVTEQAFDQALNPIRAKVDLGLQALTRGRAPRGRAALRHARPRQPDRQGGAGEAEHRQRGPRGDRGDLVLMFARGSRYEPVPEAVYVDRRRPRAAVQAAAAAPARPVTVQAHLVVDGDRLDLLAHRYLGDPEQFWRICDANGALRPEELTREAGRRLGIPLGVP